MITKPFAAVLALGVLVVAINVLLMVAGVRLSVGPLHYSPFFGYWV